jgi:hypothetical protein
MMKNLRSRRRGKGGRKRSEQVPVEKVTVSQAGQSLGRRQRTEILQLFGTIEYDEKYDYKKARMRKRKV